jgi:hypothetical protein
MVMSSLRDDDFGAGFPASWRGHFYQCLIRDAIMSMQLQRMVLMG